MLYDEHKLMAVFRHTIDADLLIVV